MNLKDDKRMIAALESLDAVREKSPHILHAIDLINSARLGRDYDPETHRDAERRLRFLEWQKQRFDVLEERVKLLEKDMLKKKDKLWS